MADTSSDEPLRFESLEVTNFLSYKSAHLDFSDFVALIGPNSSGKSNLVKAIRLLRAIPINGLPAAVVRLGGFDQLRHRSAGRPYDPSLRLTFRFGRHPVSTYELAFGAVRGKRYEIKREHAEVYWNGRRSVFDSDGSTVHWGDSRDPESVKSSRVASGQSALGVAGNVAAFVVFNSLQSMQTVEVNPALIRDLQQPSSVTEFEPDGSNVVSIYEALPSAVRTRLTEELATIVPGVVRIEVQNVADRQTLIFAQKTSSGVREFTARQMSDGTLRAFSVLLATVQPERPSMLVVEEPEMAIHLGAMRTLVEILRSRTAETQFLITTHSADILDALPLEALRVVSSDGDTSRVGMLASHTRDLLREGLVTPGDLLKLNALDAERT